jgi:hypothetical protein
VFLDILYFLREMEQLDGKRALRCCTVRANLLPLLLQKTEITGKTLAED